MLTTPVYGGTIVAGPFTNHDNGHSYLLTDDMLWTDAEAFAVDLGGHLVTVRSESENQWLVDIFQPFELGAFIGFNDLLNEGTWVWTSGEPVTYTNWRPGEPNSCCSGEDHHAGIFLNPKPPFDAGEWNDGSPGPGPGLIELTHDGTPTLVELNVIPALPLPSDFVNLNIDGIFPTDGFNLQLPPAVGIFGNDILVDIDADSPTGTPNEVPTPFNVTAPVGMLADGGYNYSVDLFVDGTLESTLQGTFSVITPVTELLSINVNPSQPTPDDIIIAEIDGTFTSAGFDIQLPLDVSVSGSDIVLDIFATSPSGSPHQELTPFTVRNAYLDLPLGVYDQTVNLFVDGVLEDTITGSFTVGLIPEPGTLLLLTLGGVALLRRRRQDKKPHTAQTPA